MVSRMWNELFKLQEKYSDYRHGGTGAVKRIDKSSGAKAIRQAKYEGRFKRLIKYGKVYGMIPREVESRSDYR